MTDIRLKPDAATDQVLPFQVDSVDVRGRIVRLGPLLNDILHAHAYPTPAASLLAEALALTALLGSIFVKDGGQITLQARGNGPVHLLVCDYRMPGELRAYCGFDPERVAALDPSHLSPRLEHICGEGYLALTVEPPKQERSQGIVALEGEDLSEAAASYFNNSAQIPTVCKLAARYDGFRETWTAGGMLLQHLSRGEEGSTRLFASEEHVHWAHARTIAATLTAEELVDPSLSAEEILWRLYHETPPRVFSPKMLSRGCRCSLERVKSVLRQFSMEALMDMREPDGSFKMNCAFCSRDWVVERPNI